MSRPLGDSVTDAWQRREALHRDPDVGAYRLFHGWDEGFPGVAIDLYGDAALIEYKSVLADRVGETIDALDRHQRFELIVAKPRGADPFAARGVMPGKAIDVPEAGLRFLIEPWQPRNPGLYLDARPARQWIRSHADGLRILNLFAFTGSLGVAAAAGGAASVTHVDTRRGALKRCKANHAANGYPVDNRDLVKADVYKHLRRASSGRRRFGGIIVDPPPWSDAATGAESDVSRLAPLAAPLLAPGGWLLCFFHHSEQDQQAHERAVIAAAGVPLEIAWRGESGLDFPEADRRRKLRLTAFTTAR